jgi:hypothetical protein
MKPEKGCFNQNIIVQPSKFFNKLPSLAGGGIIPFQEKSRFRRTWPFLTIKTPGPYTITRDAKKATTCSYRRTQ